VKRNTILIYAALLLVAVVGAGGAYWGIKKYRAKQRQEFRFEGKMMLEKEGADPEAIKNSIISDTVLDRVIKDYDLVSAWGLTGVDAAKSQIRNKFLVRVEGLEISLTYQDRDKDLAKNLLKALLENAAKAPPAQPSPAQQPPRE